MNDVNRSLMAALGVSACCLALLGGSMARRAVDTSVNPLQTKAEPEMRTSGLVASKQFQIPEVDYFVEMSRLLKQEYVDPITDDRKLANGAIRGMVLSLRDPDSIFMDAEEFAAYKKRRVGVYEGIGADFTFEMPAGPAPTASDDDDPAAAMLRIPRVQVAAVTPGGPADQAGVKPGDVVLRVGEHWVVDGDLINRFRAAQRDFQAKKLPLEKLNELRKNVRERTDRAIMPGRAKEKLMLGKTGSIEVVWRRGGQEITNTVAKGESKMPGLGISKGVLRLPFIGGAVDAAKKVATQPSATIDLRNNSGGDFDTMVSVLNVLAPAGDYGLIVNQRGGKPKPMKVAKGNAKPPKLTLLVDRTTRGVAEIFAAALKAKGVATLQGGPMAGDRTIQRIIELPDGAGYTLTVGEYKAPGGKK